MISNSSIISIRSNLRLIIHTNPLEKIDRERIGIEIILIVINRLLSNISYLRYISLIYHYYLIDYLYPVHSQAYNTYQSARKK